MAKAVKIYFNTNMYKKKERNFHANLSKILCKCAEEVGLHIANIARSHFIPDFLRKCSIEKLSTKWLKK